MMIQFLLFPATAKRFGVSNCMKVVATIFPIIYLVTPFTALTPDGIRNVVVFALLLSKLAASIFGFPCLTIMLTNSAASLSVLGTLNGVGTSVAAFGRAAGPAVMGAAFSFGVQKGYVIIPWWLLTAFAAVSAVPVFYTRETDGFQHDGDESEDEDRGEGQQDVYGAATTSDVCGTCHKQHLGRCS